jgi:hypothetical protein
MKMSSKELDNLVNAGMLKAEPPDQAEFNGLFRSGVVRLTDSKVAGLSTDSRFSLAYDAAHSFALAAMRWHGYRPSNKRFIVFQALPHTLGVSPNVWRVLDKCHGKRNLADYEGMFEVDDQLLKDLVAATETIAALTGKLGPVKSS